MAVLKRKRMGPRPKKALEAMQKRYKFLESAKSKLRSGKLVNAAVGAFSLAMVRGLRSMDRLDASIIGRPELAKRLAMAEKSIEEKSGLLILGNLPFVSEAEIERLWKLAGVKKPDLEGLKKFRCFSKEEIGLVRRDLKESAGNWKKAKLVWEKIYAMNRARTDILNLTSVEPELTRFVFTEVLTLKGINSETRKAGIELISKLATLPRGREFEVGWGEKGAKEGGMFVFRRLESGRWEFRKMIRERG